jgi:subtilisin family serine protease
VLALGMSANTFADSGKIIVKFKTSSRSGLSAFQRTIGLRGMAVTDRLIPEMGVYTVSVLQEGASVDAALKTLRANPEVAYAQKDHPLSLRAQDLEAILTPNDPLFSQQWHLSNSKTPGADTHVTQAWASYGAGGKDFAGNDVVMAVVDGGVDVKHKDLAPNLWVNAGEIPGDGIDNDENGYIDDVNGWNSYNGNGNIPAERHGTHVAGIMGAAGNNDLLVSGLNWSGKVMAVAGSSGNTSQVVKAYGYVIAQKKLWLETKGAKGANIVATNSSFGVDEADCNSRDYPVWNDLYNQMGALGILSAVATANRAYDVDKVGDVPSACDSPYIVGVTNTTDMDRINNRAAWGKLNVDLGAPGTAVVSTLPGDRTGPLTGTSMATPEVCGAIGLLHSLANKDFNEFYLAHPADAALKLKEIMLTTVDEVADLKEVTASGGRLNVFNAATKIRSFEASPSGQEGPAEAVLGL